MNTLPSEEEQINRIIDLALEEDGVACDITTDAIIPPDLQVRAYIAAKEEGIMAGGKVARLVFRKVDPSLRFEIAVEDGENIISGQSVATITGHAASILKAERTALNFLGRMSGIATAAAHYASLVKGAKTVILDTRKTAPGMRLLDKYAVRVGGGQNHRMHLGERVLVKDNHIAALRPSGMGIGDIVRKARENAPETSLEIEVNTVEDAIGAAAAGADIIMLDNMKPQDIDKALSSLPDKVKIEASGGVTPDNIRQIAQTGVDYISIGALTHSVKALDFSLEIA